jgi:hypothetical protein
MSRKNRNTLADRVIKAAEAALAAQDYVSPIDVLVGIGWLDPGTVASAGAVAATNDAVCWSSRRPWQTRIATSRRGDASNAFSWALVDGPKCTCPAALNRGRSEFANSSNEHGDVLHGVILAKSPPLHSRREIFDNGAPTC